MQTLQISQVKVNLSVAEPVKIDLQALQKLNNSEWAIIQASKGVRIKDYTMRELTTSVSDLIKNVHVRLGYKNFDSTLIEEQQLVICQDLMTYHKLLTFEELKIVIDHALAGEYSSEVFFAPAYLMQWIKRYLERKAEANKKHLNYLSSLEEKKPEPTQDETNLIMQNVVLSHFAEMSKDNNGLYEECIVDYGGVLFDFLERKHTPLTKERKFEIYNFYMERFPKKPHEEIIKKCKERALIEMLRIAHSRYLNSI